MALEASSLRGGEMSFDDVYRQHADGVYRFAFALLRDRSKAEDVTSETFAAAYPWFEREKPDPALVRPRLFRIARNKAVDQIRSDSAVARLVDKLRQRVQSGDVETAVLQRDSSARLLATLAQLSARDRQAFALRYIADLSIREVAHIMELPEKTAAKAAERSLQRARKISADMELR